MITYQEFLAAKDKPKFVWRAVQRHRSSNEFLRARDAQEYNAQRNVTIQESVKKLYNMKGSKAVDWTAENTRLSSNFFHIMVRERATYSLGNGIIWTQKKDTDKRLGKGFDKFVYDTARAALVDGVSFGFWNLDHGHTFRLTEFVPFWDEIDGKLRAGARFWSLDWGSKPVTVELYEEDGYTTYVSKGSKLEETEPKRGYKRIVQSTPETGETIIGEFNYGSLPIVPMYANDLHQSVLDGIRPLIDAYDMIQSGFANDLQECAQIYWLIGNAPGMQPSDLERFRDQLRFLHIAAADTENSTVTPYTQEIPYEARKACLDELRRAIFESCGIFDVTNVSAGQKTATEIQASYQPMDEEADEFEYHVTTFIQQILVLANLEDYPTYKRNRISNQSEQTEMILSAANYLDIRTLLGLLPFVDNGQIESIIEAKDAEADTRIEDENGPLNAG